MGAGATLGVMLAVPADNRAYEGADLMDLRQASDPDLASFAGSFNLIEDPSDAGPFTGSGNILNTDPGLRPLANNWGADPDRPVSRSRRPGNVVPKGRTPKSDQRGAPRKGKGDIGAYERVKCQGVVVNRVGTGTRARPGCGAAWAATGSTAGPAGTAVQ